MGPTFGTERMPGQFSSQFNPNGAAFLFVYAPRTYGTQVLRPFTYQFEGNCIDKLVAPGKTMSDQLKRKDIAASPEVAGAIVPEGNGTPLDMTQIAEMWTFVMIIDLISPWLGGSSMGSAKAKRRLVYRGVFLDEPINMFTIHSNTPTPNENCPMRFTHFTETVIDPAVGGMGAADRVMVRSDMDVADKELNGQANDVDLYLATPDKLLKGVDNGSGISSEGRFALTNYRKGVGVVSTLKSPLAHLRQLCMGLDQQVHLCESNNGVTVGSHMSEATDIFDVGQFKEGVAGEWAQLSSNLNNVSGNIHIGDIILLGHVVNTYPAIEIIPLGIAKYSQVAQDMGCLDQQAADPKSIWSSMVASAVSAIACNFGFSYIDFSYDSYAGQWDAHPEGSYEVHNAMLLMQPNDPEAARQLMTNALELFRRSLLTELVPTMKAAKCGDFQMNVAFQCDGETYVDLNFYDWESLKDNGVYETPNRVSNVGSTSVGTAQHFISNGRVLDSLVHSVYGHNMKNQFGVTAFGQDAGDMVNAPQMEMEGLRL